MWPTCGSIRNQGNSPYDSAFSQSSGNSIKEFSTMKRDSLSNVHSAAKHIIFESYDPEDDHHNTRFDGDNTKRAPHNAIEKRYRASINGKIDELRRILIPKPSGDCKINKSAVLRQAIERIKYLEEVNANLKAEVSALRAAQLKSHSSSPESGIQSFKPSPHSTSSFTGGGEVGEWTPLSNASVMHTSSVRNHSQQQHSIVTRIGAHSCSSTDLSPDTNLSPLTAVMETMDAQFGQWPLGLDSPDPHLHDTFDPSVMTICTPSVDTLPQSVHRSAFYIPSDVYEAPFAMETNTIGCDEPAFSHGPVLPFSASSCSQQRPTLLKDDPAYCEYSRSNSLISTPLCSGGKRPAELIRVMGPVKVRRPINTMNGPDNTEHLHPIDVFRVVNKTDSNTPEPSLNPSDTFPVVRQALNTIDPQVPVVGIQTGSLFRQRDHFMAPSSEVSNFNGMAARTTLCVAALCLITLDPLVLTGNSEKRAPIQSSPSRSTSRHLLNTMVDQSIQPWLSWAIYILQWMVALLLCFWACQRPRHMKRKVSPRRISSATEREVCAKQQEKITMTAWDEAKKDASQAAWSLAEEKLHLCLSGLREPLTPSHSPLTKCNLGFWRRILQRLGWCGLMMEASAAIFVRFPRIVRLVWYSKTRLASKEGKEPEKPDVHDSKEKDSHQLTAAQVRHRLLEVYLLADPTESTWIAWTPLVSYRLLLACTRDLIDSCSQCLRVGPSHSSEQVGLPAHLLTKQGLLIWLSLHRKQAPTWLIRGVLRWIYHVIQSVSRLNGHSHWIYDSSLHALLSAASYKTLKLNHMASQSGPVDLDNWLRMGLRRQLRDISLHAILDRNNKNTQSKSVEGCMNALLELSNVSNPSLFEYTKSDGTANNSDRRESHRWWAQFIHAAWLDQVNNNRESSPNTTRTTLPDLSAPPKSLLRCPKTGLLAEAVWLSYRCLRRSRESSTETQAIASTVVQSSLLLKAYATRPGGINDRLHEFPDGRKRQETSTDDAVPFWIVACELLAADWLLNVLVKLSVQNDSRFVERGSQSLETVTMQGLDRTISVFRSASHSLTGDKPHWIAKTLSYAETVRLMALGANPVRSRMSLLHASREVMASKRNESTNHTITNKVLEDKFDCSSSDAPAEMPNAKSETIPDVPLTRKWNPHVTARCDLLTQSPGQ